MRKIITLSLRRFDSSATFTRDYNMHNHLLWSLEISFNEEKTEKDTSINSLMRMKLGSCLKKWQKIIAKNSKLFSKIKMENIKYSFIFS